MGWFEMDERLDKSVEFCFSFLDTLLALSSSAISGEG